MSKCSYCRNTFDFGGYCKLCYDADIGIVKRKIIKGIITDIDFYLENKKNKTDKFYVYWDEIKKKMEEIKENEDL